MKVSLLAVLSLCLATTLFGENSSAPVITVHKGISEQVEVNQISGQAGVEATSILKNDIQLSGAFSLSNSATSTITVSGTASPSSFTGTATEKSGGVVLQKNYPGETRRTVHQFTNDLVETVTGQKGIALSKVAFVADRTGHKEIYTCDYDGARTVQLTHDGAISVSPALSADGRRLAYTGYQSGYADIYRIDLTSGARTRIVKFPGTNSGAAISPDGTRIACTMSKDGNPEIYVTGINGDSPRRLTRSRGVESSPTWSPDGSEIIYSSDERGGPQLYRISSQGGSGRLLTTGFGYNTQPNWSPDGRKVAFNVRNGGGFQVAILDLDSGSTRGTVAEGENPVWGPDSRHLIFARGSGLYLFDTVTGRETRLVSDLGPISEPAWSH
ncbi:MAG: PD40 domain-containing protein [Verrucomicrobia bacterium]|nr:PD40 domain-containing protein [Verrucomicrobiota bacterium]MBV8376553.1 PD40 domain-containing protein [Verrucomicrobiota bacterium]